MPQITIRWRNDTNPCTTNAVNIIFAIVREIIVLRDINQVRNKKDRKRMSTYDDKAYILDVYFLFHIVSKCQFIKANQVLGGKEVTRTVNKHDTRLAPTAQGSTPIAHKWHQNKLIQHKVTYPETASVVTQPRTFYIETSPKRPLSM